MGIPYSDRGRDLCVLAALLAIAVLPFWAAAFTDTLVPSGLDLVQHYSRESVLRATLANRQLPLWNPYEFSGIPAQADPQVGVFYPPSVLLRWLPLPAFLTWTIILHLWLFGAGGYLLCRTAGAGRPSAAIAAVALTLRGITMPPIYAGHLDVLRTITWLPAALALGIRSIDRDTIRPTWSLVAVLCLQLLGGFVQQAVYTFWALAAYAGFSVWWPTRRAGSWRTARVLGGQIGALALLVAGLTAFQLLPTLRLVLDAGRTAGLSYADAVGSAVDLTVLKRLILPVELFEPVGESATIVAESASTSGYIGLLLAAIAPVSLLARTARNRRLVSFFTLLGLLTLCAAWDGPLYQLQHWVFPMFRLPGRLLALWSVSVAVLGALALDRLVGLSPPPTGSAAEDAKPRWAVGAPLAILVTAAVAARSAPAASLVIVLAHLPALGGLAWSGTRVRLRPAALCLAGLLVVLDVHGYAARFVRIRALADRFPLSLPFEASAGGRVLSLCENRLSGPELSALGVPTVDGYNSYFLAAYARLAEQVKEVSPATSLIAYPRIGATPTLSPQGLALVSLLNVTELVSCAPVDLQGLELLIERPPFYVYRNTAARGRVMPSCPGISRLEDLPRFGMREIDRACAHDVRIHVERADRGDGGFLARVETPSPRLLSEPFYSERHAWVDGQETPIRQSHTALSAIAVPAGMHTVELRFVPTTLYWGLAISGLTLVGFGAWTWSFSRSNPGGRGRRRTGRVGALEL